MWFEGTGVDAGGRIEKRYQSQGLRGEREDEAIFQSAEGNHHEGNEKWKEKKHLNAPLSRATVYRLSFSPSPSDYDISSKSHTPES